jgi:hypothetical protein
VAYRSPRDPINVARLLAPSVMSRPPFLHAIVLDGQGVGWWRRVPAKDGYAVEARLLRELSTREQSALESAVEAYAGFVGRRVSLGLSGP